MYFMPAGISRVWSSVWTIFWHPPASQRRSFRGNIRFQPRDCCTRYSWNFCLLLTDGPSNKMFCSLKEKRTKWNIYLYFVEKIVHQTLFNLSLKCSSHLYRIKPGEMVLLHQPAITTGSLPPSSVLQSFSTSSYVCVPTALPWLLLGQRISLRPTRKHHHQWCSRMLAALIRTNFEHQLA